MEIKKSRKLFDKAQKIIPGGVNSPVRAFRSVGGTPVFIDRGEGCRIWDVDGNEYIDYVGSWGPLILGHNHPVVRSSIEETIQKGTTFGTPTEKEIEIAELICKFVPSIEKVRMVNSGTEATMSAIRLARGFTGRKGIVKFIGCYHGHVDSLLVEAGSGVATLSIPGCLGIPEETVKQTYALPYNNINVVKELFEKDGDKIAAVIVEPVAGNMGVVPPKEGFLECLREITKKNGALLIFDEVMTGFRVSRGGVQELYGIKPDITTLGKIIGGGLPVGAYGGRKDIMSFVAPEGGVYQAGTLSGNPVAMAAGIASIGMLQSMETYKKLEEKANQLHEGILSTAKSAGVDITVNQVGSMMSLSFQAEPVIDYETAKKADGEKYSKFFHMLLDKGIYIAPSQFEALFISTAHGDMQIEKTIRILESLFKEL